MLIQMYPEISLEFDERLEEFIHDPAYRIKKVTPSLGDILVFVLVSDKHRLKDLLMHYIEEQLDRQVFWIVEKIPELDHTKYGHKE